MLSITLHKAEVARTPVRLPHVRSGDVFVLDSGQIPNQQRSINIVGIGFPVRQLVAQACSCRGIEYDVREPVRDPFRFQHIGKVLPLSRTEIESEKTLLQEPPEQDWANVSRLALREVQLGTENGHDVLLRLTGLGNIPARVMTTFISTCQMRFYGLKSYA